MAPGLSDSRMAPSRPIPDALEVRAPRLSRLAARIVIGLPGPVRRRLLFDAFGRAESAFNRGDLDVVFAAFAPEVDYIPPSVLPGARPLHSKAEVVAFWRDIFERFAENSIENLELSEPKPGVLRRRAALCHREAGGAEPIRYEIEQITEFRAGQVVLQHNRVPAP